MEQLTIEVLANSSIQDTIGECVMHEFVEKDKKLLAQGSCLILHCQRQEPKQGCIYLKMNNIDFCHPISSSTFIRVKYPKSTSYIFINQMHQNAVFSISSFNNNPQLIKFTEILMKNSKIIIDYPSSPINYDLKVRLNYHIDDVLDNQIILNFNKTAKIAKSIGNFFGKINKKIINSATNTEIKINQKMERVSRDSFSDQTRSKWASLKEKAGSLNEKITDLVKPINEKVGSIFGQIGQKYRNSANPYLQSVRKFTNQAQKAMNDGYIDPQQPQKGINFQKQLSGDGNGKSMMKEQLITQTPVL